MEKANKGLIGKAVMTSEGTLFGKICDSKINTDTGFIESIKVKPVDDTYQFDMDRIENNEYIFNSSSFDKVKDIFIIDQN